MFEIVNMLALITSDCVHTVNILLLALITSDCVQTCQHTIVGPDHLGPCSNIQHVGLNHLGLCSRNSHHNIIGPNHLGLCSKQSYVAWKTGAVSDGLRGSGSEGLLAPPATSAPAVPPSRWRSFCHSTAPPSPLGRCLNTDGEGERQQSDRTLADG